jgi:dolichol-phosphate mannosyltransferase
MRVLTAPIVFNEEKKIVSVLQRLTAAGTSDVLIMDDGSTDKSPEIARSMGFKVLCHEQQQGVGAAIRTFLRFAVDQGYDVAVIMAGNDKDRPEEIPKLLEPIRDHGADLVQGSRYLAGGKTGAMPMYRKIATKIHPWLFSLFSGKKITDSTNGFRAIRLSMLKDERINLDQEWLDRYELEPYILYTAIHTGHKVVEVPVTKIYPPKHLGYTKMKPVTGWWSILRPIFLLGFGFRK